MMKKWGYLTWISHWQPKSLTPLLKGEGNCRSLQALFGSFRNY
ncbi:hypothetical protein [Sporosarcina luteola]|nr:hypothetical protein [Sporosarcina luteola]